MKIVTWNVNSVKARHERVLSWLGRHRPDVLCLQELKVTDENFPFLAFEEAGYHSVAFCQKAYNGVAILSRQAPENVQRGLDDGDPENDARLVYARIGSLHVVSVYVPNGQTVGSEAYAYKLRWLERLRLHLARRARPEEPWVVCGDFNVAPDDRDVNRVEAWRDTVLCHPEVRGALESLLAWGWIDVFRRHHPEGGVYSWWDYRMLGFPKNNGLRIDLALVTPPVAERCHKAYVDREERKGKSPSDHAPVVIEVDF